MAMDRTYEGWLWSDDMRGAVRRRLCECGGIALLVLAAILSLGLATWSVQDPSLSHATDAPVKNLLGTAGAIGSDLLIQLFGLAAVVLLLPIAIWGWRIATHRTFDREWQRLIVWLIGTLLGSAFAACLPKSASWPLPTGLGGVIGDALLSVPSSVLGPRTGVTLMALTIVLGAATLIAIAVASGFGWRDRSSDVGGQRRRAQSDSDDEEKASISLGWLVHAMLSLKARLARLVTRREPIHEPARKAPTPKVSERDRIAPTFDERAPVEDAPEEDEEAETELTIERPTRKPAAKMRTSGKKSGGYQLPSLDLLAAPRAMDRFAPSQEAIEATAKTLESVLGDFGVRGEIINARPGPVVTLYELEPAPGIKSSRVIGLSDDIARSMSALSARVAVVSGRNVIGIELPNERREKVYFREMLAADDYTETTAKLPLCLGKTIGGEPVVVDLARMPHLLIAGTTGSGKSVAINTMILSLLYRLKPEQCRLIMVDPKMLELSVYDGIPHLLTPVVTDPKKAVVALKWAVREMEERYKKMSKLGVRNIDGYNVRLAEAKAKGETLSRTIHTGYDKESGEAIYEKEELDLEPLPYIVVIVDEMADLMLVAGKDIEGAVQRLAQMA
ncbi:unnamed protein product, partial [Phaeothamnion confervicola]